MIVVGVGIVVVFVFIGCFVGFVFFDDGFVQLQMVESLINFVCIELLCGFFDDFEKDNFDIMVNLVFLFIEQVDQKIQQMLQFGKGVDVFEVCDIIVGLFVNNGWLYDFGVDLKKWDGWDVLIENVQLVLVVEDGKSYFVFYGFYGLLFFYCIDFVKEVGFDGLLYSWKDLLEQVFVIQDLLNNIYGYVFCGGQNVNSNVVVVIEVYMIDGFDMEDVFFMKDGLMIFVVFEVQEVVDDYFDFFKEVLLLFVVLWGYLEMVVGFMNGIMVFFLQDLEVIVMVQDLLLIEDQWDIVLLFVGLFGKVVQFFVVVGWGVVENSEYKEVVVKFVEFLLLVEFVIEFVQVNSFVLIIVVVVDDEFYLIGLWMSYVIMIEDLEMYVNVCQFCGVSWWIEWIQKFDQDVQNVFLGNMLMSDLFVFWDVFWIEKYVVEKG